MTVCFNSTVESSFRKVAMDEKGTGLALVGGDPPTRAYPFASVRYRIEDRKVDLVRAIFEALKHQHEVR
jgi:hypothetical protein